MARIRTLKPEFFRSRSLALCSLPARVTFQGLWCEADDYGHGVADARILKGALWPLDDEVGHVDVEKHLLELEETGHVLLYEVGGERYFEIVEFEKHQAAAYRRGKALYPAPDGMVPHADECKEVQAATDCVLEGNEEGNVERNEEPAPADAAPKRVASGPRRKRKLTSVPDSFELTDERLEWCRTNVPGLDPFEATQEWLTSCDAKDFQYANWSAAWKNAMRRAVRWHKTSEVKR